MLQKPRARHGGKAEPVTAKGGLRINAGGKNERSRVPSESYPGYLSYGAAW